MPTNASPRTEVNARQLAVLQWIDDGSLGRVRDAVAPRTRLAASSTRQGRAPSWHAVTGAGSRHRCAHILDDGHGDAASGYLVTSTPQIKLVGKFTLTALSGERRDVLWRIGFT